MNTTLIFMVLSLYGADKLAKINRNEIAFLVFDVGNDGFLYSTVTYLIAKQLKLKKTKAICIHR